MPIRSRLVQAVHRESVGKSPPRVTYVCGEEPDGTRWHMSLAEAIRALDDYVLKLYTMVENVPVPIVVVTRNGNRQLEILHSAGRTGTLLELPECTAAPAYKSAAVSTPPAPSVVPVAPDRRSAHATARVIGCINAADPLDHGERITRIGGRNPDDSMWEMTVDEAIRSIDRFQYSFYVRVNHTLVPIIVATRRSGRPFLKARADSEASETLLALPATLNSAANSTTRKATDTVPLPAEASAPSAAHDPVTSPVGALAAVASQLSFLQLAGEDRVTESELSQLNDLARQLRSQASALLLHERASARAQLFARLNISVALTIEATAASITEARRHVTEPPRFERHS